MEELASSSRRSFIKTLSASAALLAIGANPLAAAAVDALSIT